MRDASSFSLRRSFPLHVLLLLGVFLMESFKLSEASASTVPAAEAASHGSTHGSEFFCVFSFS